MRKILIIQTAFLGDVVLATSLIEKLHQFYPEANIDFLLKKGNESVLKAHPIINRLLIFDKSQKFKNLWLLIRDVRKQHYDVVVNLQRFLSSGLIASLSGSNMITGFNKNPLSSFYTKSFDHKISVNGEKHEIDRNHLLIENFTDNQPAKPKLYPSKEDFNNVLGYKSKPYLTLAPTSVWYTKQWPKEKWVEFISSVKGYVIYLLGAPADVSHCNEIIRRSDNDLVINLAGKLSPLQSVALMRDAEMNFVNDSAPLHFASAIDAPVRAIFNSTVPEFGFGPLSTNSSIIQTDTNLSCRPCGLHGHNKCPEGHFKCALDIQVSKLKKELSIDS